MRIAGINLPKEKKIGVALTYLYGIGPTLAIKILDQAKVDLNIRTKDLTSEQEDKVRALVEKNFKVEGDLRREVMSNVKRLKDIKCYRGIRHMKHCRFMASALKPIPARCAAMSVKLPAAAKRRLASKLRAVSLLRRPPAGGLPRNDKNNKKLIS